MRNSSNRISLAFTAVLFAVMVSGQCTFEDAQLDGGNGMGLLYESKNGYYMPTTGVVRVLVVLMEVDYVNPADDPTPPEGYAGWPAHQLPPWVNNPIPTQNLFDWEEPVGTATGMFTRYFQDASSGNLIVLGDYLLAPDNGGIFHYPSTLGPNSPQQAVNAVNLALGSNIVTVNGLSSIDDFDKWTIGSSSGPGLPKVTPSAESPRKYDHVMFIWRNAGGDGSGYGIPGGSPGTLLGYGSNSFTNFGAFNRFPIAIARHEFAHMLFGGNNYHYAGGGAGETGRYWISISGGWGGMSGSAMSLQSWSGWDRLQLGWKTVGQVFDIPARDALNTGEVDGDLDVGQPTGAAVYVLRDFVSSGDAIRIKLPYTNPLNEYPEYIWVENHQGHNANGNPFDRYQYEEADCVVDALPGIYMYVQIDREHRSDASSSGLYAGNEEFTRPLNSGGAYDITHVDQPFPISCVGGVDALAFVRAVPNPLTGISDTHFTPVDLNSNGQISNGDMRRNSTEYDNGAFNYNLYTFGHPRQGFRVGENSRLGIGTNPSSASMMNTLAASQSNNDNPNNRNLRRIYLNGVSVEVLEQLPDGSIKVPVRFDDVDVEDEVRWCADEIQLNPVPTASGYSLNLKDGAVLTLDQGRTATRRTNPQTLPDGAVVFVSPTLMRCTNGTLLNMEPGSQFIVDNGSTLRLEAGSRLDMMSGCDLHVRNGGKLEIMPGAVLKVAHGARVRIEEGTDPSLDGRLIYHPGAIIRLDGTASELAFAGMLEIKDNAVFQVVSTVSSLYTKGIIRFNSTRVPSQNVVAGVNTRFIVRSNNMYQRVLYVDQESLYGPSQLVEFSLLSVSAVLNQNARIVAPVSNACNIKVIGARVTSSGTDSNNHRGYRLNGQQQVTLLGSRFERGSYGLYAFNPTLGTTPHVNDCDFEKCGIGFYSLGKAVSVYVSSFVGCKAGLLAEQVSQTSKIVQSSATGNSTGIFVQGSASLLILDPEFDINTRGLVLEGMDTRIACGSISDNTHTGIHLKYSGTLRLDGTLGQEHEPLTALNNPTTISLLQANNCFLNLGNNSLRPLQTGIGKTLNGTFICGPYAVQSAFRNNWEGTPFAPLTSAEYAIFTNCSVLVPVVFDDPFGADETPCGQAITPCPNPPCFTGPELDAFVLCPSCREVETNELGTVDLNVASLEAKLLGDDDVQPTNELAAIDLYAQILMNDLEDPTADEAYLI